MPQIYSSTNLIAKACLQRDDSVVSMNLSLRPQPRKGVKSMHSLDNKKILAKKK